MNEALIELRFCPYCQCEHPLTKEWWFIDHGRLRLCKKKHKDYQSLHTSDKKEYDRRRQNTKASELREYHKKYRMEHREEIRDQKRKYRSDHAEEIRNRRTENQKQQSQREPKTSVTDKAVALQEQKDRHRQYKKNNAPKIREQQRLYRQKHATLLKENQRNYCALRFKSNVNYKLSKILRARLFKALKNDQKRGSAIIDLGCTIPEFKQYLESKFQDGMTWDNWGLHGWHIDHILPLASFDLTDREQFSKACNYTNLQPLWAEENWSKHSHLE